MTLTQLLREVLATVRSSRVPTGLILVLTAMMCAGTLATVGRTVSAERVVQQRIDSAGSKVIVLRDLQQKQLFPASVIDAAAHLSATERAVGLSSPVDVVNGAVGRGAAVVPSWRVVGDLSAVARLTGGRWPRPGEALVSEPARQQLGLAETFGWVTSGVDEVPVVGSYAAREPFADQAGGVLVAALGPDQAASMYVIAASAAAVRGAEAVSISLVGVTAAQDLGVESPATIAQLQQSVGRDLGGFNRSLVLGVMGAGAVLVAIVVLSDALVRRKDLGRRRALGANRATIVALVVLRTAVPALAGSVLGTTTGLWIAARFDAAPGWSFTLAISILSVLAAMLSAVPPAVYAARRDPVEVLRTP